MKAKINKKVRKKLIDEDVKFLEQLQKNSYEYFPFNYWQSYFNIMQDCLDVWPKKITKSKSYQDAVQFGFLMGFLTCQRYHMDVSEKSQIITKFLKSNGGADGKQKIEDLKLKALEPNFDF